MPKRLERLEARDALHRGGNGSADLVVEGRASKPVDEMTRARLAPRSIFSSPSSFHS